jgi:hypothetical protein
LLSNGHKPKLSLIVSNHRRSRKLKALQTGQLSAAGGAAASGASLEIDDAAGETDQHRGEGRAPFPEDRLPDGGGGGAATGVPDDFGTDWAAAIGNRDVRMKAEYVKTTATMEELCSHPGEKGHWSQKWVATLPAPEKTAGEPGKRLANL